MTVYLKLETCASSRPPEDAIAEALKVAQRLAIWVQVEVNGVFVFISPDDTLTGLTGNWRKALDRGSSFASGNVIPAGRAALEQS